MVPAGEESRMDRLKFVCAVFEIKLAKRIRIFLTGSELEETTLGGQTANCRLEEVLHAAMMCLQGTSEPQTLVCSVVIAASSCRGHNEGGTALVQL